MQAVMASWSFRLAVAVFLRDEAGRSVEEGAVYQYSEFPLILSAKALILPRHPLINLYRCSMIPLERSIYPFNRSMK
ncbi:hypothetical protein CSV80_07060 [Sporosarcina sp. P12(2017)]|nr:hypothetical protein CSV81_07380 [Sporosarcina sp. P10]PIC61079.1 hypothetical protein CSV80_07060 [Sporosarcina sp. P12(2017)]